MNPIIFQMNSITKLKGNGTDPGNFKSLIDVRM